MLGDKNLTITQLIINYSSIKPEKPIIYNLKTYSKNLLREICCIPPFMRNKGFLLSWGRLAHRNLTGHFHFLFHYLRQIDREHAIGHTGCDLVLVYILRQQQGLLELRV